MDVVVAGGHGKIGLKLLRLLASEGHRARGLIRNPAHAGDLEQVGAEPVICDLEAEEDVAPFVTGAGALVFAAGAGQGSGSERKRTMDLGGALKLIDAAHRDGISRYVMVSAMGAAHPERSSERMRPYIEAKAEADKRLAASGLDYTIVRPGGLSDEPGTGQVSLARELERGSVSREDVAAVLVAVLGARNTIGKAFDLVEGDTPIDEAVRSL